MKLIATLGTTQVNFKHKYYIKGKEFEEYFSFLALKNYYNIDNKDIVIIGTAQTKKSQSSYIKNYKFIEVDSNKFEEIIEKFLDIIEEDDIVDLTQSFRSITFAPLLAYHFSKAINKGLRDIFYAQVRDNCNAVEKECEFDFISLKKYEDITDLLREINIFLDSWYVINYEKEESFKVIHNSLLYISKNLLVNNLNIKEEIDKILNEIKRLNSMQDYSFMKGHLDLLAKELNSILNILHKIEYKRLFEMSKLYIEKNLLLQSLTMLFEATLAYMEYKTKNNFKCRKKDKEYTKQDDKYKFRNCLKGKISSIRYGNDIPSYIYRVVLIKDLEDFAKSLLEVDELRNNSAHVFINGESNIKDFKKSIEDKIKFFDKYLGE